MEISIGGSARARAPSQSSILICFSHLRWNFVHQRPQHLLTLASKQQRVIYFEEPVFGDISYPTMREEETAPGIRIVTPVLPLATSAAKALAVQRLFLDQVLV